MKRKIVKDIKGNNKKFYFKAMVNRNTPPRELTRQVLLEAIELIKNNYPPIYLILEKDAMKDTKKPIKELDKKINKKKMSKI